MFNQLRKELISFHLHNQTLIPFCFLFKCFSFIYYVCISTMLLSLILNEKIKSAKMRHLFVNQTVVKVLIIILARRFFNEILLFHLT